MLAGNPCSGILMVNLRRPPHAYGAITVAPSCQTYEIKPYLLDVFGFNCVSPIRG
jgi:hypothetical protein